MTKNVTYPSALSQPILRQNPLHLPYITSRTILTFRDTSTPSPRARTRATLYTTLPPRPAYGALHSSANPEKRDTSLWLFSLSRRLLCFASRSPYPPLLLLAAGLCYRRLGAPQSMPSRRRARFVCSAFLSLSFSRFLSLSTPFAPLLFPGAPRRPEQPRVRATICSDIGGAPRPSTTKDFLYVVFLFFTSPHSR